MFTSTCIVQVDYRCFLIIDALPFPRMLYPTSICQLKYRQSKMHVIPLTVYQLPILLISWKLGAVQLHKNCLTLYHQPWEKIKIQSSQCGFYSMYTGYPLKKLKVPVLKHCQQRPSAFIIEHNWHCLFFFFLKLKGSLLYPHNVMMIYPRIEMVHACVA